MANTPPPSRVRPSRAVCLLTSLIDSLLRASVG